MLANKKAAVKTINENINSNDVTTGYNFVAVYETAGAKRPSSPGIEALTGLTGINANNNSINVITDDILNMKQKSTKPADKLAATDPASRINVDINSINAIKNLFDATTEFGTTNMQVPAVFAKQMKLLAVETKLTIPQVWTLASIHLLNALKLINVDINPVNGDSNPSEANH